ncbi:MAG: DNA-protecting protein DprA [Denitrovibrio sp.]|nr:MAG: DNA-protecting protein DprA [Denitrovibrio sp.]
MRERIGIFSMDGKKCLFIGERVTSDLAIETLKLRCVKGADDRTLVRIFEGAGTLEKAFDLDMGALLSFGVKKPVAENIITSDIDSSLFKSELKTLQNLSADIICIDDQSYPELLRQTKDAPPLLYVRGDSDALQKPAISIVGSRNASRAACELAGRLACDLAEAGFNVVSGFARGIDIAAHLGAIERGVTTAVLGCGVKHFFPAENKRHLDKVLAKGCVITDFLSDIPPVSFNFPKRNRIISGMSYGVIVVEASERSGSLITARLAGEQGREVFAVPAFQDNRNNATNALLKEGAKLVQSYYDVIEELKYQIYDLKEVDKQETSVLEFGSPEQTKLFDLLMRGTLNPDELSAMSGFDIESVAINLAQMELEGYVVREIDGKYRAAGGLNGQNCHSSQHGN